MFYVCDMFVICYAWTMCATHTCVVVVFVEGVVHEFGCVCTFDPHASLNQQGFIKTKHTSLCV